MPPPTQLRGARAREAILAAAGERFLTQGLRRTSIEAIAAAAGVSRPTVYAHFASKDEIFRSIVTALHDDHLSAMRRAADPSVPVADRIFDTLAARFVPFVTLLSSSPHGAELLDENSRVCGEITRASRVASSRLLEELLDEADRAGELDLASAELTPAVVAALLFDAATGIKDGAAQTPATYRRQLRRLVDVFTRGLAGAPGS